jgi:hypothetical protein
MSPESIRLKWIPRRRNHSLSDCLIALNDAALGLAVSVGHRTGFFDVMRQSLPTILGRPASKPRSIKCARCCKTSRETYPTTSK